MTREIPKLNGKCRVTPHNAAYFFGMGAAVADGYRALPTLMDAYGRLWTLNWRKFFTISRGALGQHARPRTQIGSVWRRLRRGLKRHFLPSGTPNMPLKVAWRRLTSLIVASRTGSFFREGNADF